jgi:hypothetical protein
VACITELLRCFVDRFHQHTTVLSPVTDFSSSTSSQGRWCTKQDRAACVQKRRMWSCHMTNISGAELISNGNKLPIVLETMVIVFIKIRVKFLDVLLRRSYLILFPSFYTNCEYCNEYYNILGYSAVYSVCEPTFRKKVSHPSSW